MLIFNENVNVNVLRAETVMSYLDSSERLVSLGKGDKDVMTKHYRAFTSTIR